MGGVVGLNGGGMDGHSMARHERLYAWVVQGLRYLDGRANLTIGRIHVTTMEGGTISVCPGILGSWEEMRWVFEVGAGHVQDGWFSLYIDREDDFYVDTGWDMYGYIRVRGEQDRTPVTSATACRRAHFPAPLQLYFTSPSPSSSIPHPIVPPLITSAPQPTLPEKDTYGRITKEKQRIFEKTAPAT